MQDATQGGPAQRALWPIHDFCKSFGVSRSTAYDLLADGTLAGRKIGRRTVLTAESVERWAASLPVFEPGATLVGVPTQAAA